jgi:hypothetical protein
MKQMVEVEIRFDDIIALCDQVEKDLEFGIEVDLRELNNLIFSYFPSDGGEPFKDQEADELAVRMRKIESLLELQRDNELEKNLAEIDTLRKYRKYMDVLDMVEEKKWK